MDGHYLDSFNPVFVPFPYYKVIAAEQKHGVHTYDM